MGLTFAIHTLGCKVNQYESQSIREQFEKGNYNEVVFPCQADIYIINTCIVTGESERKSKYIIRKLKKDNPDCFIIVTGCLVSGINSSNNIEFADKIISNKDKEKIIEVIEERMQLEEKSIFISNFAFHRRAFIKIQDGCDSFCSYCIIPYVRGAIKSRKVNDVFKEIDALSLNGYKEVVLTGIHIGKYGKDNKSSIIDILKYLENSEGILRVRLSSFEPKEISSDLIDYIKKTKKISSHLHIPLQSGDDNILKLMNRNYTCEEYLNIISNIKKNIKDIAISTDIIVGFPQETEEKFNNTLKIVEEVGFSRVHVFSYSDRKQTKASLLPGRIPMSIKKERSNILKIKVQEITREYKKIFIGSKIPVLIEDIKQDDSSVYGQGYSDNYLFIKIKNKDLKVNMIYNTTIIGLEGDTLIGL